MTKIKVSVHLSKIISIRDILTLFKHSKSRRVSNTCIGLIMEDEQNKFIILAYKSRLMIKHYNK